jgi:hypothetical protein
MRAENNNAAVPVAPAASNFSEVFRLKAEATSQTRRCSFRAEGSPYSGRKILTPA